MSYYSNDSRREATSASRKAGNFTRRAEREARQAEEFYQTAAKAWREARWLTRRPDMWDTALRYTPAEVETRARCWERIGNTYLRASFHTTGLAAFYRDLAARYRANAARYAAA